MLLATGMAEERAKTYSMHSWRIYLACALLAKGASSAQILSMLRWRSDEALRLYARLNDTTYATWLDDAATADIESIRSSNIATAAEAQRAQEAREWLRRTAVASADIFDPARVPAHTHDESIAEMRDASSALQAEALASDAD